MNLERITLRLPEVQLSEIDRRRGKLSRSAYVRTLVSVGMHRVKEEAGQDVKGAGQAVAAAGDQLEGPRGGAGI